MSTASATLIQATGRCRESVATVKLDTTGEGKFTVNNRDFEDYFPLISQRTKALRPLFATEKNKSVNLSIRTHGGGLMGQAGAISLAISRALVLADAESKPTLKKNGLLTRDSRMKERKKPGQPGARKRFQFSKR